MKKLTPRKPTAFKSKRVEARVVRTYLTIDGKDFEANDLSDLIDELGRCDGLASRLVIHNDDLGEVLVKLKVAYRNVRGSYGRGPRYDKFAERIRESMRKLESE